MRARAEDGIADRTAGRTITRATVGAVIGAAFRAAFRAVETLVRAAARAPVGATAWAPGGVSGAGAPKAAASAGAPALVALAALFCAAPALSRTPALSEAAGTYDIAGSSQIRFTVDQIGGGGIKGRFTKFSGVLRIDGRRIGASTVSLTIYPQSVAAAEDRIANFLRSSAVFDAAAYPTVTFRSTAVRQTGEDAAIVDGMLTARGITHREQFAVRLQQLAGRSIAFAVTGDVYRSRYRMDVGVPIYLNVVKFDMDIRAVRR